LISHATIPLVSKLKGQYLEYIPKQFIKSEVVIVLKGAIPIAILFLRISYLAEFIKLNIDEPNKKKFKQKFKFAILTTFLLIN
jgi:hypothetical protein